VHGGGQAIVRAATFGAVDTAFVDIDEALPGFVDEADGALTLDDSASSTRSRGASYSPAGACWPCAARTSPETDPSQKSSATQSELPARPPAGNPNHEREVTGLFAWWGSRSALVGRREKRQTLTGWP
jgi:hypothetical protein